MMEQDCSPKRGIVRVGALPASDGGARATGGESVKIVIVEKASDVTPNLKLVIAEDVT